MENRPVFLIGNNERLSFQIGDTTFYYRRLPPSHRYALQREYSERGVLDAYGALGMLVAIGRYCLRGWDNVLDAEGKPVPYLEEVVEYLPLVVLQRMNELALEESPDVLMERYQAFLTHSSPSLAAAGDLSRAETAAHN